MLLHDFWLLYEFTLEDDTFVPSVEEHEVLQTTIDSHLTFHSYLKQLC